ncbi:hypothetical protein [Nonomuraea salmonea]|uniref:Uncharacterized protein n=1 Tax=Nonomuraea salmonea TaxID=46181 RepID=A0ABV5NVM2_9ACTN
MYVSKLAIHGVRGLSGAREVDLGFARPDGSYQGWTVLTGPQRLRKDDPAASHRTSREGRTSWTRTCTNASCSAAATTPP